MTEYASLWVARNGEKIGGRYGSGNAIFLLWPPGFNDPIRIIGNDRIECLQKLLKFCLENNHLTVKDIRNKLYEQGPAIYRACSSIRKATLDMSRYYVEEGFLSKTELLTLAKTTEMLQK